MYSTSNLDVIRNDGLDLVICLNPTSSLHPPQAWNPLEWLAHAIRHNSGRRLGSEAKKLRARGTEVVLIQPTAEDLAVMPRNLMSRANRNPVIEMAQRTTAAQLREPRHAELLADLPQGDPDKIHRPEGDPSGWPGLRDIAGRLRSRLRNAA
jgi:NTE family protein